MKTAQALRLMAGSGSSGPDLFELAARALTRGLGCRWAGVREPEHDGRPATLLALWDAEAAEAPMPEQSWHELLDAVLARDGAGRGLLEPRELDEIAALPLTVAYYRGETFGGSPPLHIFAVGEHQAADGADADELFRLVAGRIGAEHRRWTAEKILSLDRQLLAATDHPIALIGPDYRYLAVNRPFADFTHLLWPAEPRWTRQSLVGHSLAEVQGEKTFRDHVKSDLDRCLAGQDLDFHRWFEQPDGRRLYINLKFRPLRDDGGEIAATLSISDLTRRRLDQREIVRLATSQAVVDGDFEATSQLVTESAAHRLQVERVGIWLLDERRRELSCPDLFERSPNRHSSGLVLHADDYPEYFAALTKGRAIDAHEARTDPRTREFTDSYLEPHGITSMLDATIRVGGEVVGVICHEHVGPARVWQADELTFAAEAADLVAQILTSHNRLQIERQLHQAQKLESLGVLAGGIAHDFNNLLVGILGAADLISGEIHRDNPKRQHLDLLVEAATQASDLCSQMLAYSGKANFVLQSADLSAIVEGTAQLLKASLDKKANLVLRLETGLPAVEVDVTQVRQIVMNLLTNASDSLPEQGGTVTLTTGVHTASGKKALLPGTRAAGQLVYLQVTDTGCGMDEDGRKRIFEPFFTTKFTGRGLGLAAVQGIVRSHGGAIEVDSSPGEGTRFRVYFPAAGQAVRVPEEPAPVTVPRPTRKARVLIVDDEAVVRSITSSMLAMIGIESLSAEDGLRGIEVAEQHADRIDLVILDLTMPHISGEEAFDEIRQRLPEVPIVISTGYAEGQTMDQFESRDVAAFLHKPFRAKLFTDTVLKALAASPRAVADQPAS